MESESSQEYKALVDEITKGMERVKQVRASSSGNHERILDRMFASYEEALLILNGSTSEGQDHSVISSSSDPPNSSTSVYKVTQYEDSSRVSDYSQDNSKRRIRLPSFTKEVKVSSDVAHEGLDDGHSWRKYGQKDILGSKYPRSYYRCAYRHTKGCLATKQVQRSADDPSIFAITYQGEHACIPGPVDPLLVPPR